MSVQLVIAEKPSVARSIAAVARIMPNLLPKFPLVSILLMLNV